MNTLRTLCAFALACALMHAQTTVITVASVPSGGSFDLTAAKMKPPKTTWAALPDPAASADLKYLVTDANATCDGGGGTTTPCEVWSNGSAWLKVSSGGGTGSFTVASEAEVAAGTDNTKGITSARFKYGLGYWLTPGADGCFTLDTTVTPFELNYNAAACFAYYQSTFVNAVKENIASTDLSDFAAKSGTGTTAIGATITSPQTNEVLKWDGAKWVNGTGGAASGKVRTKVLGPWVATKTTGTTFQTASGFWITNGSTATAPTLTSAPIGAVDGAHQGEVGVLQYDADVKRWAHFSFRIPDGWDGTAITLKLALNAANGSAGTDTVIFGADGFCFTPNAGTSTTALTYNAGTPVTTTLAAVGASGTYNSTLTLPITGCSAGQTYMGRLWRDAVTDVYSQAIKVYIAEASLLTSLE